MTFEWAHELGNTIKVVLFFHPLGEGRSESGFILSVWEQLPKVPSTTPADISVSCKTLETTLELAAQVMYQPAPPNFFFY